jgi:formate dehydrogenase major subunit
MESVVLSRRGLLRRGAGASVSAFAAMSAFGADLQPARARAAALRIRGSKTYPSVCPYCAVGCDTVIHTIDGQIVNVEGDVRSPINQGTLCPKGAAIYQLHVNPNRVTEVLYRRPGGLEWERLDLETAMDMVAERVKRTRDATFVETTADGVPLMHTLSIFSLGGATMDNEWNHIHQKLLRGLGIVAIENQARI